MLCYTYETDSHSVKLALWVGVLGCGDTPVNVVRLLVRLRGRGARLRRHPVKLARGYVFKMSLGLKHFVLEGVM